MKTTYVVILPNGSIQTRASDSMIYRHALAVQGGRGGHAWGVYSWHITEANARKAAGGRIREHHAQVRVLPVEAVKLTGKALAARLTELEELGAELATAVEKAQR
jgi:hypothetical protein